MKMNDERRKVIKELLDVTDREFTDDTTIDPDGHHTKSCAE